MKLTVLLATVLATLFLSGATARAEDPAPKPAAEQQQQNAPAPKPGAAQEKPAARREDVEPSTLTEAKTLLKTARDDRDEAEAGIAAAEAAHEKTKQLLKSTLETCKTAQADRDKALADLAAMTKERDTEKKAHGKTTEHLSLAEAALEVKGVKAGDAIPAVESETTGKSTIADFDARLKAEKDPARRAEIRAEFSKAAKEGRIAKAA